MKNTLLVGTRLFALFCGILCAGHLWSQTTVLIDPNGDGGFENGATFAANGWTVVNGATNQWFVGSVGVPSSGSNCAYISDNAAGATYNYSTAASTVHFYRDVTFPAGQTFITLSFKWKAQGEGSYDYLTVYAMPTANTPTVNVPAGGFQSWNNISVSYPGAVILCTPPNLNLQNTYQTQTICLPPAFAGTTQRLVFMWSNDGSVFNQPPGAIDDISLVATSVAASAPTAQPTNLTLTPGQSNIGGTFTAAAGSPDGYLVVRTLTNTPPSTPVNGTFYAPGANALGGVIVASGPSTSFNATGLVPNTTYYFWVYAYNGSTCNGGPAYLATAPLTASATTLPCAISGTKSIGPTGDYPHLTAAVADLVANGADGNVFLELQPTYTSALEPSFPVVLPAFLCASPSNTVTIRPAPGATGLSLTSGAIQTIDINGGQWWRIDGRPGGAGTAKELTIANTSTAGNAVRFVNEASNNIIRYCDIRGVNTSTTSGVILFSTTTNPLGNGNDNNLIEFNEIRDGATTPANCIYSLGSTTTRATFNSNNTIANNNIYNFFLSTGASVGIVVTTGSDAWTITGNSFYQTAPRSLGAFQFGAMNFPNTITGSFVVTNNFIGGTAPNCGGGPMTLTGSGNFRGMNFTVSSEMTLVQGNTIRNINLTTSNATQFNGAILLGQGTFNCTENTIGDLNANGSIALTFSGSASGFAGIIAGGTSPTNTTTISNNSIGGVSMTVSGAPATPPVLRPISVQGTTVGHSYIITGNTVGSPTLADNITSDANVAGSLTGIVSFSNAPNQQITNNTIANMTATSTGTANVIWGILAQGTSNIGTYNIVGNTIRNLSSASGATGTGGAASIMGISIITTSSAAGTNDISQNTIHTLVNTNPTAAASVTGINNSVPAVTNNTVARNFIHSLNLQSSTLTGIITGIQLDGGTSNVQNNMIRLGINADGNSITNGYGIFGIREAAGNNNVRFNSVYIGGTGVDGGSSNTFAFTSAVTSGTRNYLSNIFFNARSNNTSSGKHYAITFAGTAPNPAGIASNYNDLYVTGTGGHIGLYNGVDQTTLAAWRTATGNDFQSVSGDPQFIIPNGTASTVDLHIQPATPTVIEGGAQPVLTVADDFDGQLRSSFTPSDIGADAGNFLLLDQSGPGIAYTPLIGACGTGNVSLNNVQITDGTGIPLSGSLIPRIYYRKGAGSWFSNAGTLVSGTSTNSIWNFTIVVADMGGVAAGDVISYYVIAQDNLGNIGSNAGGAVAVDVNSVTIHPVTPNTATVQEALSGVYTVGVGGDYATLTAAVNDYNNRCINGPVVFSLIDAAYPSETFPITINANAFASAVNTLTIRPASGNSATISGSSTNAIIRLNGADWVIIDGSNSGGTDRNLTLINTSSGSNTAVLWLSSVSAVNGTTNNTIKNCNILAGSNTVSSTFGIYVGGTTISTTGTGDNNDNIVIQNNVIKRAYYGIYARASSYIGFNDGLQIIGNEIGSATPAEYVLFRGMDIHYANAPLISQNKIFNMNTSTLSASIAGIDLGTGVLDAQVVRNNLTGIKNTSTGGWGSYGILISGTTGTINALIANNFISDMTGSNYTAGTTFHAYGIRLAGGYYTKVYHNSINFYGPVTGGTSASVSANLIIASTLAQGTEIVNNIFRNVQQFAVSGSNIYNIYLIAGVSLAASNNNDYFGTSSSTTTYHVGFGGNNRSTLFAWRQFTGKDGASVDVAPSFESDTDLHLTSTNNFCLDGGGVPLAVTDDIDGDIRSATAPDIGADEVNHVVASISVLENSGVAADDGITCAGAQVTLEGAGGISYSWNTGFSGNPLVVNPIITTTYTVTVTDASTCTEVAFATITVNPLPTAFNVTGGGAYCAPGAGVPVGLSGSEVGVNYQLRLNGVDIGTSVAGTGNPISFGLQNAPGTYSVFASSPATACAADMTGTVQVTADPTPATFNVTGGGAFCEGGPGVSVGLSGSETGVDYQLILNGGNTGSPVAGTGNPISFGLQTQGGTYTVLAISTAGCTATMNGSATVTVNPAPSVTAVVMQPMTCVSADGAINQTVTGNGPFTYEWFTPNGSGLQQGQEDQSALTIGTYFVTVTDANTCSATAQYNLVGPGGCEVCPTIGSLSTTPAGACAGANVTITASGLLNMGVTYGITFKYYLAPPADPYVGGTVIATVSNSGLGGGGTTATTTTSFATGGTYYLVAILDILPPDPTCRPSAGYTLTVLDIPSVNPVSNQTVCSGTSTAPVNFSGPVPGTVYNWTNNTPSIGLAASGSGNIPSFTAVNTGNAPITATITVTPSVSHGPSNTTCTGTPITFTITVNPTPTVTATPAAQTVCNGAPTQTINFTGTVPGTVFNWTNNNPSIGLAASGSSSNIPSFTAVNTGTTPVTATITVTPSFTNNGATCTGTPATITITVNPTPTVSAAPTSQTICNGAPSQTINFSGTVPGTVFNWTNNNTSIGLAASGSGNSIPTFTAINTGGSPVTATITVTPSFTNNGVTCTGTPATVTITVNPTAQVNQPANVNTCSGSPVTVTFTTTTPGSTFSWTNSNPAIGLPSTGSGNISFTAATVNSATTGTITVTPNYTNNGVSCPGTPRTFTITVNPLPTLNSVPNQSLCSGDPTTPVNFTGNFTTVSWTNSNPSIGLPASGTGNIPSFITINNGTTNQVATITVTPVLTTGGTNCTGTPITFTYTVFPRPTVTVSPNTTICQDQVAVVTATIGGGATSGTWSGGAGTFANPNSLSTTYTPAPSEYGTTVTLTFTTNDPPGPCPAVSASLTVTVNTLPIVDAGQNKTICPGATLDLSLLGASIVDNGSGVTTGTWSTSGSGTFQPNNSFPGATTYVPSQADYNAGFVQLRLTSADPAGPCNSVSDVVFLYFKPLQAPTCNDKVQISLDSSVVFVHPDMILEGTYDYDFYRVDIIRNSLPSGNQLTCADVGKTFTVRVTDICTNNMCWGTILVEDKLPPSLTCNNYNVVCVVTNYNPNYLSGTLNIANAIPTVVENCPPATLTYVDDFTDLDCSQPFSARIRRTWTATDGSGNKSSCIQTINLERRGINNVLPPVDVTISCSGNVNTSPSVTGAPYFSAYGQNWLILPTIGQCEIQSAYVDQVLPTCDGSYKIIRTWTVLDWCLPTKPDMPNQNPRYYIQVINVTDNTGPTIACPANLTVSTDPFTCCGSPDLPDVLLEDACSRIKSARARIVVRDPVTNDIVATHELDASLQDFPTNNPWSPDTLAVFGGAPCLPLGAHTVTYFAEDDCGNTRTCTFRLTVDDQTPPSVACVEVTQVALGASGEAFINASTFDKGSYDNCGTINFKARRMDANSCQSNSEFYDRVKFCCDDIGKTIRVVLRVYDVPVVTGAVSLTYEEQNSNDCMVEVLVEDKIKPFCTSPANVTVSCENFDPSLSKYGVPTVADNCCIDTITQTLNLALFDTLCNRGTITRTFRVVDCAGNTQTCSQRVFVNYESDYFIRFPNDVVVTVCDGTGSYGEPTFFGKDCEALGVSYDDVINTSVPDACYLLERTWRIVNWCQFNPNQGCINVPNPEPNPIKLNPANRPGPVVSPLGTPAPWNPTVVAVTPGATPTNYSTFWSANANCYTYKQLIWVIDNQKPIIENCPADADTVCDLTDNNPQLWNEMYWWDASINSHDLCEAPTDLNITATDLCSGALINFRYLLCLDLDGDGKHETVISSANLPGFNNVNYGNANNPNYTGGTPRQFDFRPVPANQKWGFALQVTTSGNKRTAAVRWNTQQSPNTYVVPELPYGKHKIVWVVDDGCGNEQTCEYEFEVKDCKKPTIICKNIGVNIMPTKMVTINVNDVLQETYDNCTPSGLLVKAIRKEGQGAGFPLLPNGQPQTTVTFTCAELGERLVEVWSRDVAGNADFCVARVNVQDNMGNCSATNATIAGALKTEDSNGLQDADVNLSGVSPSNPSVSLSATSDVSGDYALGGIPLNGDYTVVPLKDDDHLNGVSTFDLVLINKHILGIEPLGSPYKMIAADANNSRSITTFDIVELRKLILGIYTELPNNTSWRFVDKDFAFPDAQNPFKTLFPETKQYVGLTGSQVGQDFVAVKVGDVNGTAITSSLMSVNDRTSGALVFDVDDRRVKSGEVFTVRFRADALVEGYQFTLNFPNLEVLEVTPLSEGMTLGNFGVFAGEHSITTSFNNDAVRGEFAVTFRAKSSGELSRMLQVSGLITKAEAYSAVNGRQAVALRFNSAQGPLVSGVGFELYQNRPNPWVGRTQIGFHVPEATEATLTVFDESGRIVWTQRGQFAKGYNAFNVDRSLLEVPGVLYYRVETPTDSAVRKMIQTTK
jgi:hypothetical protein